MFSFILFIFCVPYILYISYGVGHLVHEMLQGGEQVAFAGDGHAEEVFQLLAGDEDRRPGGETDHHRMGDEVDQRPHARDTQYQLDHPHHEGQLPL